MDLRRVVVVVEDIHTEAGREVSAPVRTAVALAVIGNPCAGVYVENLDGLIVTYSEALGKMLGQRALEALGVPGVEVEAYGKAVVVGLRGEVEHGAAIVHNARFGGAVRAVAGGGVTLLPATEKVAPPGAAFDVPLAHTRDGTRRSHHKTVEVRLPDAPRPDEIVVAIAFSTGGRPLARLADFGTDLRG